MPDKERNGQTGPYAFSGCSVYDVLQHARLFGADLATHNTSYRPAKDSAHQSSVHFRYPDAPVIGFINGERAGHQACHVTAVTEFALSVICCVSFACAFGSLE